MLIHRRVELLAWRAYPPNTKPANNIAQIKSKEAMIPITSGIAVGFNYVSQGLCATLTIS